MAFIDVVHRLVGILPGLSPFLAQTYVNHAWEDIRGERPWNFLITDGMVICPAAVTTGTASITQYQSTVTLSAAASAAVLAQTDPDAVPGLIHQAIRFGVTSPGGGQIYHIREADAAAPAAIVLTLDRVVVEATAAASTFQIYRPYIVPPMADFAGWISLSDFTNGRIIDGDRLLRTSVYFDARDPQRNVQGQATMLGLCVGSRLSNVLTGAVSPNATVAAGSPIYEFWPHPTSGQTFYARFRRSGVDFTSNEVFPSVIPEALVLTKALGDYAYPFAAANVGNFPQFQKGDWRALMTQAKAKYNRDILSAKNADDDIGLQTVYNRGHHLRYTVQDVTFPIDSNFLQSHLINL